MLYACTQKHRCLKDVKKNRNAYTNWTSRRYSYNSQICSLEFIIFPLSPDDFKSTNSYVYKWPNW